MRCWFCVNVKTSREDDVCLLLKNLQEIETFNPKIRACRYVRSKPKWVHESLFPGYIFVRIDAARYSHAIKYTRGVKKILGDKNGHLWAVDPQIVEYIKLRILNETEEHTHPSLNPGDAVRITDGPLAGIEGIFCRHLNASERVMILLTTIESLARVHVDRSFIEKK